MHITYLFKFAVFAVVFDAPLIDSGSMRVVVNGVVDGELVVGELLLATFLTSWTPLSLICEKLENFGRDEDGVTFPLFSSPFLVVDDWFFRSFSFIRICFV